jgi:hypothetical protein
VSNINYLTIEPNFPVAGQDNDTQTFRDNFSSIRTNFQAAQEEITDLQNNTAKLNVDNDFQKHTIEKAVMLNMRDKVKPLSQYIEGQGIDYEIAPYQVFQFVTNNVITFENLPGDIAIVDELVSAVGKLTLELYGDATLNEDLTQKLRYISFTSSGGAVIKKSGFPTLDETGTLLNADLSVWSNTDPVIIEVWRHSADSSKIFVKYVGLFE